MSLKLAIIEDDPLLAYDLEMICQDAGWSVLATANSMDQVKQKLQDVSLDVIISDMQLIGPENGADAVTWLKARNPDLQVIFVTGTQDAELLHRIDAVNPQEVFSKPVDPACLVEALGGMAG